MEINQALSLMLVSAAAAILPGLSRLLRLPAAVLEILFGVVLGKSLLQLQFSGDWLQFLAHLGFLLLLFHAGMEINFGMLSKQTGGQFLIQLLIFAATLGLSFASTLVLGWSVFLALILSTSSLDMVMSTLRDTGASKSAFGQSILVAASLADFLALFGITFFVLGREHGLNWHLVLPLPLFVGFAILLWAARLWAWWYPQKAERFLGAEDSQELGVRLSLALLFFFVAASELVHIEPVLGAFLGGCVLSFVFREKGFLEQKISALGFGFLIPIFFINVGLQFDLRNIFRPEPLLFTLQLLVLAFVVKVIPGLLFTLQRIPMKTALRAGILLSSRLSLIIAAASIGVQQHLITPEMKDAIVLLALLTCLIAPTVFKLTQTEVKIMEAGRPGS